MYEAKRQRPRPRAQFARRFAGHFAGAMMFIVGSFGIRMTGYQYREGLDTIDAFLNAALLLDGLGPVDLSRTDTGDLPAGG